MQQRTLLGHPTGLFTLFFAEMWERFSFYGMRALLVFYILKGFLHKQFDYGDTEAYAIYGAYCALVYMAPFFGGMLADRLLGARRAVVLGGLLMAAGQLMMMVETSFGLFTALALLITGNGFFKPNISTIVGSLYPKDSIRRDGGFTIFYMGVNLGAAIAPLLCGYVGETFHWRYGFGLATAGMLTGVAIFVAPMRITQVLIGIGSVATMGALCYYHPDNPFSIGANVLVGVALLISAGISLAALERGGIPHDAGAPPDGQRRRVLGLPVSEWAVYLGTVVAVVAFVFLVSGFAPLMADHRPTSLVSADTIKEMKASEHVWVQNAAVILNELGRPANVVLLLAGLAAVGYVVFETLRLDRIGRHRMYVVLILTFFSMLFWMFYEQAGSSINNFTDRNVDRVSPRRWITASEVGQTIQIQPTQAQLGYHNGAQMFTREILEQLRDEAKENKTPSNFEISWTVAPDNVGRDGRGMGIANRSDEIPASTFQSVNAILILAFGLGFTALWTWLGARGLEPSTPVKFALGMLQLGLGFVAFWYGAWTADERGMVSLAWLYLGYLMHTTGELCLSPVGLSMITKLSPARLVSTVMGTWFLATGFAQSLAAVIAQFTGVTQKNAIPRETVHIYGSVFGKVAIAAIVAAAIFFLLTPLLSRWMHREVDAKTEGSG